MSKAACDCHSYNGDFGAKPEVKLSKLSSVTPGGVKTYKDVMIDACIAPVIKHLWDKGVNTGGSCCGHNTSPPSIVLGLDSENYTQIRDWITEVDDRWFELSQWKRVLV